MKNFVVMYNPFDSGLFADILEIQGKTAISAAREFVKGKYNTVKRSGERNVNLCLVEGWFDKKTNTVHELGRRIWYKCENI